LPYRPPFLTLARMSAPKPPPSKDEIALLEPFAGLPLEQIFVVTNGRQAKLALAELLEQKYGGFDTESRPTFRKGEKSAGPHVLQFATTEKAFIFQQHVTESQNEVIELLQSTALTKVGFGLKGDLAQISSRYGVRGGAIVDLDHSFRRLGYRNAIGAKTAIAMFFGRKLTKSKSVTTSNWSLARLTDQQLIYAANDAFAAIQVYEALKQREEAAGA
jgi:ribonuclease D